MDASKEKLQKIMDQSLDVICTIDRDGRFVDVGAASKQVWGYTPEELQGSKLIDLVHLDDVEETRDAIRQISSGKKVSYSDKHCVKKDGSIVPVSWSAKWDEDDGLMYCVIRDATDVKKQRKEALDFSERYRYVIKATSDIIWDWDLKTGILNRTDGFQHVYGGKDVRRFKSIEDWAERVHPEERKNIIKKMTGLVKDPDADQWEITYRYLKSDNKYAFVLDRGYIIRDKNGKVNRMIGAMQDLTEFKEREERARTFHQVISDVSTNRSLSAMPIVETLAEVLKISANTLDIDRANAWLMEDHTLRCIASYHSGKINGMRGQILKRTDIPTYFDEISDNRVIVSNKARKDHRLQELIDPYFKTYNIYSLLDTSVQALGKAKIIVCHEAVGEEKFWTDDEILFAGTITDQVAQLLADEEKREKEQELRESLKEKETLLAELHHRVKNNLAIISGMIHMQAFEEEDEAIKNRFMDWISRVDSIASIHDQLYQTESFSKLKYSENLRLLASKIVDNIFSNTKIDLVLELEPVELNINQALPVSLIVNEIMTNIIKYAFQNQKNGKIWIVLAENNNLVNLTIRDNGAKLPSGFATQNKNKTLGLKLIATLAEQLGADYKYDSLETGTIFSLQFKKSENRGSTGKPIA